MDNSQPPLPGFDPEAQPKTKVTRELLDKIDRLLRKAEREQRRGTVSKDG